MAPEGWCASTHVPRSYAGRLAPGTPRAGLPAMPYSTWAGRCARASALHKDFQPTILVARNPDRRIRLPAERAPATPPGVRRGLPDVPDLTTRYRREQLEPPIQVPTNCQPRRAAAARRKSKSVPTAPGTARRALPAMPDCTAAGREDFQPTIRVGAHHRTAAERIGRRLAKT